ncbi:CDP-6-deoxy-delta-3,4-glucoseen reductase [Corticibacter populi]|uniref:CDP-6-deoxy-delta-3,4-glucoseen reductase n=1 Tax=Corticibacter populi TaxID=1550736 RepID=A0A3M6QYC6_9BURK|nr:CDP-6-deoxy-delta-3,4-glucoseen reductase [Corticibacter populi]RMX08015.1 CDP-6-deoxy-delta-3,4-glucoseen reductase [Corticibacter populi]RZS35259.1 CDP-4-dehydro-6-deoxyglucose reductase [Corticibacter populi]
MNSQPTSYNVTVLPSSRSFQTQPDEFILAAAIRQGIGLPYGCKDGACGSCKCRMERGEVQMLPYAAKALSEQERQQGYILTCRAKPFTDVVIESRQVTDERAFPIRKMPVRVRQLVPLGPDVMQVLLQLPATETFRYHAGQYVEFLLKDGSRRAYSMAVAPHVQAESPGLELHIRHHPGGQFTEHVFTNMKEKEILRIEGPFGSFYLREDSGKPIILLASGTGFAPIKAMLEHVRHKRIMRPIAFYWGGRRPADLYMNDWVLEQVRSLPNLHYVPVVSNALPEDDWQGRTGFVHQAVLDDFDDLSGHEVYACGAPIVVDSARTAYTESRSLPEDAFYADAFTTAADVAA